MSKNDLQIILSDNTSGSTELVLKINKFIKKNIKNSKLIKQSLKVLKAKMQNFEVVMSYINDLDNLFSKQNYSKLKEYLNLYDTRSNETFYKIYMNLMPFLKDINIVFTLSNSKTVFEVVKYLHKVTKNMKVITAESRPAFEGRILAKKLLKLGIKVTLIPDCDTANYISKCNVVLIGADKILSNGSVVNKTGSKNAAIIAQYFKKPFYVLASDKKLSDHKIFRQKLQNPEEIWRYKHHNLKIENYYFETIPGNLISKIITESDVY